LNLFTRPTFVAAALAVAVSTFIALLLQLGLLGALGTAASARDTTLTPIANVQAVTSADASGLKYDTSRGPAVAQARAIQIAAKDVLAINLRASDVAGDVRGIFGWLSTRDLRRSSSTPLPLTSGSETHATTLLLVGHPRWRDTLTQLGLGVEGRPGQQGGALINEFELVPAHPLGAMQLMARAWFGRDVAVVKPAESASRLLPLALWFVLIALISVVAIALAYRQAPAQRAAALRSGVAILGALAIILTLLGNQWPVASLSAVSAIAAVAALWLIEPIPRLTISQLRRWMIAAAFAVLCVATSPWIAAVACVPGLLLVANQWRPGIWSKWATLVLAAPILAICAIAQKMFAAPALLTALVDPTPALATIATSSAGLPGFAVGMFVAHHFWPAPAQAQRWSAVAATAAAWAFASALLVLTVPGIAALGASKATMIAMFLPFLACVGLAVRPKFAQVAATFTETESTQAKTEEDLSAQAMTLLESHAERVKNTLLRGETGAARTALGHMHKIAAAARITALAEVRVALATGDLAAAEQSAGVLREKGAATTAEADALLELAHRQDNQPRVIELAATATQSEGNTRALALAQLRVGGTAQALATLSAWPDEATFAREIAELNLLNDDVPAAQQAMVNTGISLTDPVGEAYIARLSLRVQGPTAHARAISRLALWHPQVGAAQAAQGELMLRQGNATGARARFVLAMKLDPVLWPLQKNLQIIDAKPAAESNQ